MRIWITAVWTAALSLLSAVGAWAGPPQALLVKVDGPVEPLVESFAELRRGDTLTVGRGGKVSLLRYSDCAAVEIVGGQIVGGEDGVDLRGADVASESHGKCPGEITVGSGAVMGGVVVRGAAPTHQFPRPVSVRPTFVFPGTPGKRVQQIELRQGGRTVRQLSVRGRRAVWPKDAAPLKPGSSYELLVRLDQANGNVRAVKISPTEDASALSVIRLDRAR